MVTKTVYNERTKLTASLINLVAMGLITAGIIAPVAGRIAGLAPWAAAPISIVLQDVIWWAVAALIAHLAALALLRDLVE